MSGSLHKKRQVSQKQNSHRLSNTKIINTYNPLSKLACSEFVAEQKQKNTSRKTNRLKTTRRHQLSVQHILQTKYKEPYSIRSVQIQKDKGGDSKLKEVKIKKKKKEPICSIEESRFNIPVYDFSRSNSLIVFSEKDSTINAHSKKQRFFFSKCTMNPVQAVTLIQKTWRGYLTRKLLQQYINDEQHKLFSAFHELKSREQSFFADEKEEEKGEEMNFSQFSSIQEDTVAIGNRCEAEWSYSRKGAAFTEMASSGKEKNKQSPTIPKNFFKNHRTEPDFSQSKLSNSSKKMQKCHNLALSSETLSFSYYSKPPQSQHPEATSLQSKITSLKAHMQEHWNISKKQLKEKLIKGQFDIGELAHRSNKVKQIHESTKDFLGNVMLELQAILEDIDSVVEKGMGDEEVQTVRLQDQHQPKSQMFTLQLEDNQPEGSQLKQHYSQGQLKIQTYLNDLLQDYKSNFSDISELQYLCQVLKINTERGVKTITERCLLQFTVQTITSNYQLQQLSRVSNQQSFSQNQVQLFMVKWINEINKWQMGPIQQVTQAMQSSSFINGETSKSAIYQ